MLIKSSHGDAIVPIKTCLTTKTTLQRVKVTLQQCPKTLNLWLCGFLQNVFANQVHDYP